MSTKNYQLNDAKMFADITDGMAIVINSSTGVYYGMNGFGTTVFESLISGLSLSEIREAVSTMPGAPDDILARLDNFIETLVGFEIIIPGVEGPSSPVSLNPQLASMDGYLLECKEYKDVQELLFADPIHDVKEDKGWSPE